MSTKTILAAALASAVVMAPSARANGQTDLEQMLAAGGHRLDSDQIAQRIVGKTVTFVVGAKRFLVHYGPENDITGRLVGKSWADTGYYGITDDDRVCLSWRHSDKGRLRCLAVVEANGELLKFKADGRLAGTIARIEDGKTF